MKAQFTNRKMGEKSYQGISRNSNPAALRELKGFYKGLGYQVHITPSGKAHETLWVAR